MIKRWIKGKYKYFMNKNVSSSLDGNWKPIDLEQKDNNVYMKNKKNWKTDEMLIENDNVKMKRKILFN